MTDLKDQLIKLGSKKPKLRKHLRPILAQLKTAADTAHFKVHGLARQDRFADDTIKTELREYGYEPEEVTTYRDDVVVVFKGSRAYDEAANAVGDLARSYPNISKAFRGAGGF